MNNVFQTCALAGIAYVLFVLPAFSTVKNALREILEEVEQKPHIRFVRALDANQQVMIASDATQEGTWWPDVVGEPPETGRILRSRAGAMEWVFPAFFARVFQRMPQYLRQSG